MTAARIQHLPVATTCPAAVQCWSMALVRLVTSGASTWAPWLRLATPCMHPHCQASGAVRRRHYSTARRHGEQCCWGRVGWWGNPNVWVTVYAATPPGLGRHCSTARRHGEGCWGWWASTGGLEGWRRRVHPAAWKCRLCVQCGDTGGDSGRR